MIKLTYKVHRILSYCLFLQIVLWIIGGVVFAIVPFDSVIKGGAVIAKPLQDFSVAQNEGWNEPLLQALKHPDGLMGLSSHNTSQGLALKLQYKNHERWFGLSDGLPLRTPRAEDIQRYAYNFYKGEASIVSTRLLEDSEYHFLGLVDELYGKTHVWQVSFDDDYDTRLYFTADTGQYLTVRNDYWVLYDALWRLHIMDYQSGENFNNALLRIFAVSALLFVCSGIVLSLNTVKRTFLKRRRARLNV